MPWDQNGLYEYHLHQYVAGWSRICKEMGLRFEHNNNDHGNWIGLFLMTIPLRKSTCKERNVLRRRLSTHGDETQYGVLGERPFKVLTFDGAVPEWFLKPCIVLTPSLQKLYFWLRVWRLYALRHGTFHGSHSHNFYLIISVMPNSYSKREIAKWNFVLLRCSEKTWRNSVHPLEVRFYEHIALRLIKWLRNIGNE